MSKLKEYRKRIRLSQAEVGNIIGVRQQTICNWENGISEPTISQGLQLSRIYKVGITKLFPYLEKSSPVT